MWVLVVVARASALEVPGVAAWYAAQLESAPIATKAATSAVVFGASDLVAQRIEGSASVDRLRAGMAVAVGGAYFGPAAHFWYGAVTALLPGSSLPDVLCKAALGQLLFGPLVTCVFFATACIQQDRSLRNLPRKIRADLLSVQLAGVGFWPLVDLVSYSFVPLQFIPLFVNLASFIWTIFLSLKSRAQPGRLQSRPP